jgi:membrane protein insertase Oxa1/YidC/SpoIIIJ
LSSDACPDTGFVALYNVSNLSVELRQSPFGLWLTVLSAKDPYYILPVLMGLSMLAMQKMTPSSLDSMQNKIMMFMPVVLTFMFISLPSGLVLYFTVSNLLSMAQQFYINKYSRKNSLSRGKAHEKETTILSAPSRPRSKLVASVSSGCPVRLGGDIIRIFVSNQEYSGR